MRENLEFAINGVAIIGIGALALGFLIAGLLLIAKWREAKHHRKGEQPPLSL